MHLHETIAFLVFVAFATWLDLFVFNKGREVGLREAARMSALWILLALGFSGYVFGRYGAEAWMQYLTGYALEEALSIDNLFVIAVIFSAFGIQGSQQRLALSWGIIGAVAMRGALIFLGVGLVEKFDWLLPVFGAFLVYTGIRMFMAGDGEEEPIEDSRIYQLVSRVLPVYAGFDGNKIITWQKGRPMLTLLGMAIVIVESTDLLFAIDSIPAVMGVTRDAFIILTSNIFAVMGLRALYFLLAGVLHKFRYLKVGLAAVLCFIGGKMIALLFGVHVETWLSLTVVLGTIGLSILVSLFLPEEV